MLATLKYRDFCSILIQYTRNNYNNDTYFCRSNLATIWEYFAIYIFWGIDTLGVIYSISTADNDVILTLATFFAAKYSPYTNTWSTHNNYSKCPQSRHTGNGKPLQYTASLIYTYMASPHTLGHNIPWQVIGASGLRLQCCHILELQTLFYVYICTMEWIQHMITMN